MLGQPLLFFPGGSGFAGTSRAAAGCGIVAESELVRLVSRFGASGERQGEGGGAERKIRETTKQGTPPKVGR